MSLVVADDESPLVPRDGPSSVDGLTLSAARCLDDLVCGADPGHGTSPFPEAMRAASLQRIREGQHPDFSMRVYALACEAGGFKHGPQWPLDFFVAQSM